jgi:hypothetical protein
MLDNRGTCEKWASQYLPFPISSRVLPYSHYGQVRQPIELHFGSVQFSACLVSPRQTLQQYLTSYLRLLKSVSKRRGPIGVKPCYIIIGVWIYLVFSSFWQRKAFFSFYFGADSLLGLTCADLPPKNFLKHAWIDVVAHGSRRRDKDVTFTLQLDSFTVASNGTQKCK